MTEPEATAAAADGIVPAPSCDAWLSVHQQRLREPLFHREGLERLRRLARRLPGNSLAAIEIRLAEDAGAIDLSLRVNTPAQALQLAKCVSPPHLRTFLSRWPPDEPVQSVWLELDLNRESKEDLVPSVCAKLLPDADPGWITGSLLPALHGRPLEPRQRRLVECCLRALPAPAYLLYAFSLLSRGGDDVRLEVFGLDPQGIAGYLERVAPGAAGWAGPAASLLQGVERIHLSLDLGTEVRPRIGVEGSFPRLPGREPRWRKLFDRLVDRGLCRPEEREAALAWPGYETFWTAPAEWPVQEAGTGGFCFRLLSHVKLVCRPDREPRAKVYLLFGHARHGEGD